MTELQSIEKSHLLAAEWFKTHKATICEDRAGYVGNIIEWRRPDTSNYRVRYTIFERYVVVTGDLGDAIYDFGQTISWQKLRSFDWHYFFWKCVASETGRNYTMKIPGVKCAVPNCRAIAHFVGLQMALKQLPLPPELPPEDSFWRGVSSGGRE